MFSLFKKMAFVAIVILLFSCSTHKKSNITANEEFIVELKKPTTRGGAIDLALQGLFLGANYFAEKTSKSLSNSYTKSVSINDYYNMDKDLGGIAPGKLADILILYLKILPATHPNDY